jgi:signal peptidase I
MVELKSSLNKAVEKTKSTILFWRKDKKEKKKMTLKDEVKEWVISFIVVAVIYFIVLPAILSTSSPMVVVSSCSEAGYLNIGDILVLKGVDIETIRATEGEVNSWVKVVPVIKGNTTEGVDFNGKYIKANDSNDIIVYVANPYGAQIIHRVLAKVKMNDRYYLITKGDANPLPDQFGIIDNQIVGCWTENPNVCVSTPVTQNTLVGKKVFFRIPIVGHLKLLFCDIMPFCDGHSNAGTGYEFKLWC